jgi:hypothetical protein
MPPPRADLHGARRSGLTRCPGWICTPGEVIKCEHPHLTPGECDGNICGPGTFAGSRSTISCQWSKSFDGVEIGANGGAVAWSWGQPGLQARCGLCTPDNSRCVNVRASVTSYVTSSPFNLMPSVQDKTSFYDVL